MTIYPCLTYRDVRAAMAWLGSTFEVKGQAIVRDGASADDQVDHAILSSGDGKILVESERPEELHGAHSGCGWVYITVADADAHYELARAAGAEVLGEPHDYGEGFRGYSAKDCEGNLWTFGTARP
jgi:uncharacterized glyoxalase superfamily protein PhnB